jgi:hypothetical protein
MKYTYLFIACFLLKINLTQAQAQDSIPVKTIEKSTIIISDGPEVKEEPKVIKVEKIEIPTVETVETQPQKSVLPEKKEQYTEISLNTTSLISRIAPFGNALPLAGPTTLYLKKYKGNRAFRFGILLKVSGDAEFNSAIFRIGVEKRKILNKHWAFTRATDFMWAFGQFDTPGFGRNTEIQTIGVGFGYGVEYIINKNISLSTEATAFVGLGGQNVINFKVIPPIALYINVKLFQ